MNKSDIVRIIAEEVQLALDEHDIVKEDIDPVVQNLPSFSTLLGLMAIPASILAKKLIEKGITTDSKIKKVIDKIKGGKLNETITYDSTTINGRKVTSSWAGNANNLDDFIKLIKDMPETLESIKVTKETSPFNPASEKFEGPITPDKKESIISIVKDVDKQFKEKGQEIHTFELKSYYGPSGQEKHLADPAYIQYRTKESDRFVKSMSSGKYGDLD